MPDQDFSVSLSADVSAFTAGMQEAKGAAEETAESVKGAFEEGAGAEALEKLGEQAKEATEKISALGEGLKGVAEVMGVGFLGAAIEKTIGEFINLATEVQRTATVMGTSMAEGHAWVDAAELSGVAVNSFTQASKAMNAQVLQGGKQLHEMGISLRDNQGEMKTSGELIEETIGKLENYTASVDRNALAQKTLGRGWIDLVANGQALLTNLDQQKEEFANAGTSEAMLVAQGKALQAVNAQIEISWMELVTSAGPALVGLLKYVADSLMYVTYAAQTAAAAIASVFSEASHLGDVAGGIGKMFAGAGSENPLTDPSASASIKSGWDQVTSAIKGAGDEALKYKDTQTKLDDDFLHKRGQLWVDHMKMMQDELQDAGTAGEGVMKKMTAPPAHMDKGGGGGKGGGADPMAGVDDSLLSSQVEMNKLAQEFQKLGSESQMAAKASESSFSDLRAKAVQDYQQMMDAHKAFADAVQKGDAEAAKASEKDWKDATKQFQQDWEAAKQKAAADLQQIKSTADTMASEVSGILNQAISGKLNWVQEFDKILSQMLDKLIKHLAQQVAMWAANEMQVNAIKQAGMTTGLAEQKAANTAAGTSDAVTAAKGAYSSAAQIPYVGWLIAPIAGAAAFAGVEAFGSAQGGYAVPPGQSPMALLHPNEWVLPANISVGLQQLIASGGGGPRNINVTSNVNALDARSVNDIIDGAHASIAKAAAKYHRGGGRTNLG